MFEDYNSRLKLQNSLGAAYIKAGDYANAVNLYTGIVTEEKKRAHDIFAFLPEGQRELYWKMKEPLMNNIFKLNQEGTVTVARGSVFEISKGNRNLTSSILYDASLLNKGLLLEAFLNMQRIIISSGDQELINAFNELRELKGSDPKRAEQLEQTIISKVSSYGDFMDFTRIGWQDVRDNLQANEAAIEFVVSETDDVSYYSAEILRKNYKEPQHVFLFAQKNEDKSLGKMNIYSNDKLYKKTWGKIEKYLKGCKDIYFAPVGEFYRIGMEYLLVNESVRINDIYNMHRLSSTKSIATRKDGNDLTSMTSAALYGGLDYNLDSENMEYYAYAMQTGMRGGTAVNLSNTRSLNEVSWGYLRGTADEVTGISGILEDMKCRTALYTGGEGVEESFKMLDDKSPQVIHVATHGFFFEPSSDISVSTGLVFAGANNYGKSGNAIEGIDDGLLTSKEIAEMNLTGAELVVLSACQTGVGEISGEGVFGLQRGFKKACAETLLMSLWEVDDNATNELMTRFYSGLASGLDKHEALHEAQNHVMQTCGPDPSLWAGFILLD
jgi:CHAT domain-containing protein